MQPKCSRTLATALLVFGSISSTACMSAYIQSTGGDTVQNFPRIYLTDYNTAWQSVLEALKNSHLDVSNREGGYVQTKWTDNTTEKNFTDSFGSADSYLKAQYRFRVSLGKGYFNGHPTIKITVEKEQMVQRDVLEGWFPIQTDGIDETTLLYRIGRLIYIKMKFAQIEDEKAKKAIENSGF